MAKKLPRTKRKKKWQDDFPDKEQSESEYSETVRQVNMLAGMIEGLNIEKCLDDISNMNTILPLMNPTLYMAGSDAVGHQTAILKGALEFKKAVAKHKDAMTKSAESGRKRLRDPLMGLGGII